MSKVWGGVALKVAPALASLKGFGQAHSVVIAVVLGSLVTLTRIPLQGVLGADAPFIVAWPGVILAAFIGGFWPAVVASALGLMVGQWALIEGGSQPAGPGGVVIFAAFALVFAAAGGARKAGMRRAKAYAARVAELQAQLTQVGRLNAVGELAGSLAHELNQPLTAIANYLNAAEQILAQDGQSHARAAELVRKAATQAVRAGEIVSRVRASVDRGEIAPAPESLCELVQDAVDVAVTARADQESPIRYAFDWAADEVMADRIQVQQVVLNLVRNALEAVEGRPQGEVVIGSREAAEPDFLEAYVADNGPGIAPEVAGRLFHPFVSSKSGGMGVGLSISRNIIEAHGGRMWAAPSTDGGASFHFTLPKAVPEASR